MIYIEERAPIRLPGWSSLFVSFKYNSDIVSVISQISLKHYNKKTTTWEIPITELKYLVENLSKIDKIQLDLLIEESNKIVEIPREYKFKTKPFKHQLQAIEHGINNKKWLLLDDMGLGKALVSIYIAELLYYFGHVNKCLVVCGLNSLKWNWETEIEKHSILSGRVIGKYITGKGRVKVLDIPERIQDIKTCDAFFHIVNIETLRDERFILAVKSLKYDMLIVDEIQYAKDPGSLQGMGLLNLSDIEHILPTTGTIIENKAIDAFVPMSLTGHVVSSYTTFKTYYCDVGKYNRIIGYKNTRYLKEHISRISLRRKKSEVLDLPPKTYQIEYVEMDEGQTKFYNDLEDRVKEELLLRPEINLTTELALKVRLRQATACPQMLTIERIDSAKLQRLYELIEGIIEQGDKVLVFSTYKQSLHAAEGHLRAYNSVLCDGDVDDAEIEARKRRFQEDKDVKIMLATWQKMGTGHTLTAANYVIFIDTPYNDSKFQQACDRAYRIGTAKNVFIITLVTKGTYDEDVLRIVENKEMLSDFMIDDVMPEDGNINFLLDINSRKLVD